MPKIELPPRIMWSSVTNPNDAKNWVVLRFQSKKVLEIAGSGSGGRAECLAALKDNEVMFGGFVVYGVDKRGGVTSKRAKFVHFAWVGPKVPIMHRSRASSMGSDVSDWFGGAHMTLRVGPDKDDLSEVEIVQKLLSSGGAHKPKLYDFGGNLGPREPEAIKNGPEETSDGSASISSPASSEGETKVVDTPVVAKKEEDTAAQDKAAQEKAEQAEAAAEKKRAAETAATEKAAQDAADKAKIAAKKRESEVAAAEAAAAKTEKAEELARANAAEAAKTAAATREATKATPKKQRRQSISDVKAAELIGVDGPRALILTSSIGGSAVESKERRVKDLFLAFNVAHELVDGANKGIKERRDELFGISGVRGSYPQIFVVGKDNSTTTFIGSCEDVVELSDSSKSNSGNGEPTMESAFTWAVEGYAPPKATPAVATKSAAPVATSSSTGGNISDDPNFMALLKQVSSQLSKLEARVGSGASPTAPTVPAAKKTEAAPASVAETKKTDAKPKVNAMARSNLFAQIGKIDQSSGRTAGLKQVKKDANGKKFVADDQSTKMNAAKKARLAKMRGGGGAAKKKVAAVKAPICELRGKKWAIENQVGMVSVDADKCSIKHNVYIYNCKGATIQILGKVNGITVDKCTKTNVVFTDVMGGCELVNCKQTKVQANGQCATVAIDKTDGCVVYAGRKCFETLTVVASKSSEMNISWPGATDDDAWLEAPIPEQYQHHIKDAKVSCDVSDLYTH